MIVRPSRYIKKLIKPTIVQSNNIQKTKLVKKPDVENNSTIDYIPNYPICVLITTKNRTTLACNVIDSLIKNIKYNNIHWIICDDCSDNGHVEKIKEKFSINQIENVHYCYTKHNNCGLGANLNNGLKKAFEISEIVLTTEDDWILQKELNLEPLVRLIFTHPQIAGIRLGCYKQINSDLVDCDIPGYKKIKCKKKLYYDWIFNNQVMLRHKRIYDKIGYYITGVHGDETEKNMNIKFCAYTNYGFLDNQIVLWKDDIPIDTMDDPNLYFIHCGTSTYKQKYRELPERYAILEKENTYENSKCVTIAIITHNRTHVACSTIDYLIKNIKYDNIKWCISDDRSDYLHIEKLLNRFYINGINDVKVCQTTQERYGLGAAINNALYYAWKNGNIVLTVEDDWILQKELYLKEYVDVLDNDENVSMIRLAYLDGRHKLESYNDKLYKIGKSKFNYIFNNQVALRHKRVYDVIGYNKENCNGDIQEEDQRNRYNNNTNYGSELKVLFPKSIKTHTFDDPSLFFIHVGKSTSGHVWYEIPKRYNWIYENEWLKEINNTNRHEIVLITDLNYSSKTIKMIKQIRKFSDIKVNVLCWHNDASTQIKNEILSNVECVVVDDDLKSKCVDCAGDLTFKKGYFVPPVGLLKFSICDIFKELNSILYLDCDIIIKSNFEDLLYSSVNNYYCCVVCDAGSIKCKDKNYIMLQQFNNYFNSGVLLMNLKLMRDHNISNRLFNIKKNYKNKELMDQDVLNIGLMGNVKYIDNKYNCMLPIINDRLNNKHEITLNDINLKYNKTYNKYIDIENEAVFLHFASGWAKPWNTKDKYSKIWFNI